jgi:hypothetical protein
MKHINIYTTGIADWNTGHLISRWSSEGDIYLKVTTELQKYYTDITVHHYDPYFNHVDDTITDHIISKYYLQPLDPYTLDTGSLVYDYAHIMDPLIINGEVGVHVHNNYHELPIHKHAMLLKIVYDPAFNSITDYHISVDATGEITTLYDRMHYHNIKMGGMDSVSKLIQPYIDKLKQSIYRQINQSGMEHGKERLVLFDTVDLALPQIITSLLWNDDPLERKIDEYYYT